MSSDKKNIPLVDLVAQYRSIKSEIDEAIAGVIERAAFIGGVECDRFEEEFASFCEAEHAVGVGNGTDALILSLRALGVGKGDEVIVPANTFIATSEAVSAVGAVPVFVDVDIETALISEESMKAAISKRTAAVIAVHLYGRAADMTTILRIAKRKGIAVIEDAAQAHGARWGGRRVGSLSNVACFSFYPGKNLGAYGDAGAIVTNDNALAERVRLLKNHGRTQKYIHDTEGYNSRLDNLQAAILSVKLKHLDQWNSYRETIAGRYRARLEGSRALRMLSSAGHEEHVYHLFVVRCEARDDLREALQKKGISTGIHYPLPLHLQPAYARLGHSVGSFPNAEKLAATVLSLPIYAEITDEEIDTVTQAIREWLLCA